MKDSNNFKNLIKDVLDEINQEIEEKKWNCIIEQNMSPLDYVFFASRKKNPSAFAVKELFAPNFWGMILGFATARLFHMDFGGYIFFGIVFAFLEGILKSCLLDDKALKYALVKNTLLVGIWVVIFALFFIIYALKDYICRS